jgi:hypothetical protein
MAPELQTDVGDFLSDPKVGLGLWPVNCASRVRATPQARGLPVQKAGSGSASAGMPAGGSRTAKLRVSKTSPLRPR